ncbi:MAG TPA: hypothetical protein VF649_10585 [Sphingomonas sp.]|jgi:hypothetical protein|uniref:hypothetical protein n=1 Tax=Sphingomonas sp. TaxID=28214 RepID=UPI002EDB9515
MKPAYTLLLTLAAVASATGATAQSSSRQAKIDEATSADRTGKSADKVICRTSIETGSLVKRTRRCMTSAQWAMRIRGENDSARRLVQDNAGLVNGN